MNPALLIWSFSSSDTKKYIAATLVVIAVIVSLPFLAIISMGSDALTFLSGTSSAEAAETQGFYMGGPVEGNTYAWGNCTYWTYAMRLWSGYPIPTTWGNANTWDDRARVDGYEVNHTPQVGAVFQTDAGEWGHVAYVKSVDGITGKWTISEMNAPHLNVVSTRTFAKESAAYYTFIHDKKGASTWKPFTGNLPLQYSGVTSQ